MHPWLEDLTLLNMLIIFNSKEKCKTFFTDMGLLPRVDENNMPRCPRCLSNMRSRRSSLLQKVGWFYVCEKRDRPKEEDRCSAALYPTKNTLFYSSGLSLSDMIILIYSFVTEFSIETAVSEITRTRYFFNKPSFSRNTLFDTYSLFRQICEVHASYFVGCLGGPGKKLKLSDTFCTRRKYSGKCISNNLYVVGIYCEEDQEGVFVEVDENEKLDLLSTIRVYCHPETVIIPLNSVETNNGAASTGIKCKYLVENEYKKQSDTELMQDHLKKSFSTRLIFSRRDMSQKLYWRIRFCNKSIPERIEIFLSDIRSVFPGPLVQGLRLRSIKKK